MEKYCRACQRRKCTQRKTINLMLRWSLSYVGADLVSDRIFNLCSSVKFYFTQIIVVCRGDRSVARKSPIQCGLYIKRCGMEAAPYTYILYYHRRVLIFYVFKRVDKFALFFHGEMQVRHVGYFYQ